jgi:hypothetical protein
MQHQFSIVAELVSQSETAFKTTIKAVIRPVNTITKFNSTPHTLVGIVPKMMATESINAHPATNGVLFLAR